MSFTNELIQLFEKCNPT